jgi:hypothetical protein
MVMVAVLEARVRAPVKTPEVVLTTTSFDPMMTPFMIWPFHALLTSCHVLPLSALTYKTDGDADG